MTRTLNCIDSFCGGGGMTAGLMKACRTIGLGTPSLLCINHAPLAIAVHKRNNPYAAHLCQDMETVDPLRAVKEFLPRSNGIVDLLASSPECIHYSNARGGKPRSEQSRATIWQPVRWAQLLHVRNMLIENVPELEQAGPLGADGQPLKSKKGEIFKAYIAALRALNFTVDWRVLDAADYGACTSRKRLFILCKKGKRKIHWPEPTHSKEASLFCRKSWRGASEILDMGLPARSIFNRKRPLAASTMSRIEFNLEKFAKVERIDGVEQRIYQPFIVPSNHGSQDRRGYALDRPLPTITANFHGLGLVLPAPDRSDIQFRMLEPREFANAMGFPESFRLLGSKRKQVWLIGNAVAVDLGARLCAALLGNNQDSNFEEEAAA